MEPIKYRLVPHKGRLILKTSVSGRWNQSDCPEKGFTAMPGRMEVVIQPCHSDCPKFELITQDSPGQTWSTNYRLPLVYLNCCGRIIELEVEGEND